MADLRLFTAVRPPPAAIARVVETAATLASVAGGAVRWVAEANLHVTLQFLGATPETNVALICGIIERAVSGSPPMRLRLNRPGAFPSVSRPRTLWIGLDDTDGALRSVDEAIRREFRHAGVAFDGKPLVPHLTIGYLRREAGPHDARRVAAALRQAQSLDEAFVAQTVSLMESRLGPRGPGYSAVRQFSTRGAATGPGTG